MSIVGARPESGVRIELQRLGDASPWRYEGRAVTPSDSYALAVRVSDSGEVEVDVPPGAPPTLADRVRLVFRAAYKHARADGAPPPRTLVRWRSDV